MASLALVASHRVNGVAALHSELMVQTIFADYAKVWPERFHNVTNGVTPRRWLQQANPKLSALIDGAIGTAWRRDLAALSELTAHAKDPALGQAFLAVKRANKEPWPSASAVTWASWSAWTASSTSRSNASTSTSASCSTCCT